MISSAPSIAPSINPTASPVNKKWIQMGESIDGEAINDQSGWIVRLSSDGSIVAIGALYNDGNGINSGHVRVYQFILNSGSWSQLGQDIDGEHGYDLSSYSIDLSSDGKILAIGAPLNDNEPSSVAVDEPSGASVASTFAAAVSATLVCLYDLVIWLFLKWVSPNLFLFPSETPMSRRRPAR